MVLLPGVALAQWRGRRDLTFLWAAVAGGAVFMLLWRAQLGQVEDWNLYAIVAQPVLLVVFAWLAVVRLSPVRRALIGLYLVLAVVNTSMWVHANHIVAAS